MTKLKYLTALATLAVVFASGGAQADPYVDSVVELQRVDAGFSQFNTTSTPDLTTDGDDGDNGSNALGKPDFAPGVVSTSTTLGFDENGTTATTDDIGGQIVLAFDDNVCMNGAGMDIMVSDVSSNESALVDVSNDRGKTFVEVGEVGPGVGYELDLKGAVSHFEWIRITATDYRTNKAFAGLELDAVTCLNSVDKEEAQTAADGCDVMGKHSDPGLDVQDVVAYTDGLTIYVDMTLCGPVSKNGKYMVHFDYTGRGHGKRHDDEDHDDNDRRHNKNNNQSVAIVDDGPDTLDGNWKCKNTADLTAAYHKGRERGGIFMVGENQLSLEVDYLDMYEGQGVVPGSKVLFWIETRGRGHSGDHVPTTEGGDRCNRPQLAKEVMEITLQGLPLP